MATIKDIAKKANVSIATVSYALNGDPRIKAVTAQKVLEAAKELNYVANGVARSLRTSRSMHILVLVNNFIGPIYNAILENLYNELAKHNYQMFVCNGASADRILLEKSYEGIINYDPMVPIEILLKASHFGYPIIDMTRVVENGHLHSCVIDNFKPIYEIVETAYKEGYRRFGFMRGKTDSYDEQERYAGFMKAMADFKLKPVCILQGAFTSETGHNALKNYYVNDTVELPELMICGNDEMAIGCYDFLKNIDSNLIKKMRIIGFDNIQLSKYYVPQISTVDVYHEEWIKYVVALMFAYINKTELPQYVATYKIVRRESF